jgi:Protein kinase domain
VSTSVERAKFVRQLYNLRHVLERDEETEDTKEKIVQLEWKINQYDNAVHMKSFHTKDNTSKNNTNKNNTNKRRRVNDNEGEGAGGGAGGVNLAACAELTAHGYEVKPQVIVDERGCEAKLLSDVRQPLIYLCAALKLDLQMPPHILTVYQRSFPGKTFIAKKVPEESDEIKFLKHLNTRQQRSEHIISLHDSFPTQSGSWVILPKMRCVADIVSLAPGKVAQVCWGLIKGVAYIHNLYIAHRDIKPANLVVDRDFCLKIIDFDVATQVNDEDEVVDGQCGTKGWMAPEMKEKSMYSPIKADRWSTGQVILYLLDKFKKEDTVLRATARKLTAHNPEQRSSMLQVAASLSDVAKVAVERKALQFLQDAVEVDGENAKPSSVKKQKLSVYDWNKRGRRKRGTP